MGKGDELQNEWFVEERIHIGARCVGAMRRLLAETVDWTIQRQQFGTAHLRLPGRQLPAGRLGVGLPGGAAAGLPRGLHGRRPGADRKLVHHRASAAKLFASEAAYRCADRAVQAFGGRGYMRTNTAERFLRELRVDRIWEGTSEIQRLIVARGLERRGVETLLDVTG